MDEKATGLTACGYLATLTAMPGTQFAAIIIIP
jgi:hypothetical protein